MNNQDFEAYAKLKNFTLNVALNWEKAFDDFVCQENNQKNMRVLDYGCGDGKYYQFFLNKGMLINNIYGVEVSKIRIERCKAIGWELVYLIKDGQTLPFNDHTFDFINLSEVIEHIPRTKISACLDEIFRVLHPDGYLFITTPNYPIKRLYDFWDAIFGSKWERFRDDPTHVSRYSNKKLKRLLGEHFTHVQIQLYKEGFLYRYFESAFFMHKMLAVCSNKPCNH